MILIPVLSIIIYCAGPLIAPVPNPAPLDGVYPMSKSAKPEKVRNSKPSMHISHGEQTALCDALDRLRDRMKDTDVSMSKALIDAIDLYLIGKA